MNNELLQQVIIVNKDLSMKKGKIAAQVAHGTTLYMSEVIHTMSEFGMNNVFIENFKMWMHNGLMMKIVLKASENEMNEILSKFGDDIWMFKVIDMGLTQVEANSFTCIATEPITKEISNEMFEHLKLL